MVFLDLGILPIAKEIEARKLTFLHHILRQQSSDPVRRMYHEQLSLPHEANWANECSQLRSKYDIDLSDLEIQSMSKESWKYQLKCKIKGRTFTYLCQVASDSSKSKNIKYTGYSIQSYFNELSAALAKTLFKFRSRSVNCRTSVCICSRVPKPLCKLPGVNRYKWSNRHKQVLHFQPKGRCTNPETLCWQTCCLLRFTSL